MLELYNKNKKLDIIFLDPPYESNYAELAAEKIFEYGLLAENGIIVLETDNKEKVHKNLEGSLEAIYDERKYGRVYLIFLRRKG